MVTSKSFGSKLFDYLNLTFLLILTFFFIYPFIYCIAVSFNDGADTIKGGIYFFPRVFTLENYKKAFDNVGVIQAFSISVLRTAIGSFVSVIGCSLAAYSLSYKDLPGKRGLMFFIFFSSIFGGGLIPTYIIYRNLNLINNFWVYIVPTIFSFYNILIMKAYFQNAIPESLRESSYIDGASHFKIYWKIYMPLAAPILATVGLFVAVGHWNDWFAGMYYVKNEKLVPLSTLLKKFSDQLNYSMVSDPNKMSIEQQNRITQNVTPESFKMAILVITVTPIVMVYPFIQKYFVKGVMIGSIKE